MAEQTETKMSSTNEVSVSANNLDHIMRKELECCGCGSYCHPPLQQCIRGHLTCKTCIVRKCNRCPKCGDKKFHGRVIYIEKIHALLTFPCQNQKYGCLFEGKGIDVSLHQDKCPFFRVICYLENCLWNGYAKELFKHYSMSHPNNVMEYHKNFAMCYSIKIQCSTTFITHLINWYGRSQLVVFIVHPEREVIGIIATNFERDEDVGELKLKIDFILKDGARWTILPKFVPSANERKIGFLPLQKFSCQLIPEFRRSSRDIPYDYKITIV